MFLSYPSPDSKMIPLLRKTNTQAHRPYSFTVFAYVSSPAPVSVPSTPSPHHAFSNPVYEKDRLSEEEAEPLTETDGAAKGHGVSPAVEVLYAKVNKEKKTQR